MANWFIVITDSDQRYVYFYVIPDKERWRTVNFDEPLNVSRICISNKAMFIFADNTHTRPLIGKCHQFEVQNSKFQNWICDITRTAKRRKRIECSRHKFCAAKSKIRAESSEAKTRYWVNNRRHYRRGSRPDAADLYPGVPGMTGCTYSRIDLSLSCYEQRRRNSQGCARKYSGSAPIPSKLQKLLQNIVFENHGIP